MNVTTSETGGIFWKKITIPKGLPAFLETLTKEVLRQNPQDIVPFLSKFIDELIEKRDREEAPVGGGKGEDEENALLSKQNSSNTVDVEEAAASKIQAGFRGYQTRKSLKTKKKDGLTPTPILLTPLNTSDIGNNVQGRLENTVDDEEIAAEIKTPLETIREESIDGSLKLSAKEPTETEVNDNANASPIGPDDVEPPSLIALDEVIEEDDESEILLEIKESLTEEIANVSQENSKSESLGQQSQSQSEEEVVLMGQHINELLNSSVLSEEDDDVISDSQSMGNVTDVKGASLEIHESEVETLMESESKDNNDQDLNNKDGASDVKLDSGGEDIAGAKNTESLEVAEEDPNKKLEGPDDTNESVEIEKPKDSEPEISKDILAEIETIAETDAELTPSGENGLEVAMAPSDCIEMDESGPVLDEVVIPQTHGNDVVMENENNLSDLSTITNDEEATNKDNKILAWTFSTESNNTNMSDDDIPTDMNNSISFELPSLKQSERASFANTDSASSSTTTITVRHASADVEKQQAEEETSSPSDTVAPPPSSPLITSVNEVEITTPVIDPSPEESKEVIDELEEASPVPVLRRPKASPKPRGRAVSSKYRSGIVMDDEISMEEMEAQIENEMMSQAATKIQAGFRGYKTRKNMLHSRVSTFDDASSTKKAKRCTTFAIDEPAAAAAAPSPMTKATSDLELAIACAETESLPSMSGKKAPPLAFLRSRSFPGSAEDAIPQEKEEDDDDIEHPSVELDYDPAYVNNAAVKIQASVRGYLVRQSFKRDRKGNRQLNNKRADKENDENEMRTCELIINPAERDSVSPVSEAESSTAATKIQAAFRGYKDRQKVRQTKKAVVTIQATVRGFLTRRRLLKLRRRSIQRRRSSAKCMMSQELKKMQNVNDAATKIQAVYRGYQVRSKIRKGGSDE